jgi:hypothetical protein
VYSSWTLVIDKSVCGKLHAWEVAGGLASVPVHVLQLNIAHKCLLADNNIDSVIGAEIAKVIDTACIYGHGDPKYYTAISSKSLTSVWNGYIDNCLVRGIIQYLTPNIDNWGSLLDSLISQSKVIRAYNSSTYPNNTHTNGLVWMTNQEGMDTLCGTLFPKQKKVRKTSVSWGGIPIIINPNLGVTYDDDRNTYAYMILVDRNSFKFVYDVYTPKILINNPLLINLGISFINNYPNTHIACIPLATVDEECCIVD